MKITLNTDKTKAKWFTDKEKGKLQKIKQDNNGKYITVKGEKYYINHLFEEKKEKNILEKNDIKVYHAYHQTKTFWDNMFDDVAEDDYYHYRSKCTGMPKSFFQQKINDDS